MKSNSCLKEYVPFYLGPEIKVDKTQMCKIKVILSDKC